MISKKLIHQVVTFLNNYLNIRNVTCGYTYYGKDYISISFSVWSIKRDTIEKTVANYGQFVSNENDFNTFKQRVIKNFDKDLMAAREQSDF